MKYNYYELLKDSNKNVEAFLVLFYLLSRPSRERINYNYIKQYLRISTFPKILVDKGFIKYNTNFYWCEEPQCRVRNLKWLNARVDPKVKTNYIWLLSQRSMNFKDYSFPKVWVDPKYWNNPFTKQTDTHIYLYLETLKP